MRNNPANTKIREKGRGGGALCAGAEIPPQPMKKTMVQNFSPCSKDCTSTDIHATAHGGPYAGAGGYSLEELQLAEYPH